MDIDLSSLSSASPLSTPFAEDDKREKKIEIERKNKRKYQKDKQEDKDRESNIDDQNCIE